MPNNYAKLGQRAGDILAQLVGGPRSAEGYTKGYEVGAQGVLRQAQAGKASAETAKILDELKASQAARDITGVDIAESMGVPRETAEAITGGATTMPAYVMRSGETQEDIAPTLVEQTRRANTARILQQLGGGNVQQLAAASKGLQEQAMIDQLLSGARAPKDVAPAMAAVAGRDPTFATAGSRPAAAVQEMQFLMSEQGGGHSPEEAARIKYGDDGAKMWIQAYTALVGKFYEPEQAAVMATQAVEQVQGGAAPGAGTPPPGSIVKVYK